MVAFPKHAMFCGLQKYVICITCCLKPWEGSEIHALLACFAYAWCVCSGKAGGCQECIR
jgi:hypothetical protein